MSRLRPVGEEKVFATGNGNCRGQKSFLAKTIISRSLVTSQREFRWRKFLTSPKFLKETAFSILASWPESKLISFRRQPDESFFRLGLAIFNEFLSDFRQIRSYQRSLLFSLFSNYYETKNGFGIANSHRFEPMRRRNGLRRFVDRFFQSVRSTAKTFRFW